LFLNGIAAHQIWFQVTDGGEGAITNPVVYPVKENRYGPIQLLLTCGSEVTIYTEVVGYGVNNNIVPSVPFTQTFEVLSWTDEDENSYSDAQDIINESPSDSLKENLGFVSLQTVSLPCFSNSFIPVDSEDVLDDILNSPPPDTVEEVLEEAAIIAVIDDLTDPDALIERLNEYLEVVRESHNPEAVFELGALITEIGSNIIDIDPKNSTLDNLYDLVDNLESVLLCNLNCGDSAREFLSKNLKVGASVNTLEDLGSISIGDLAFFLPMNLVQLQESSGGVGHCVSVGYSLIDLVGVEVPTGSLTFFSLDCATGEWEEIPITITDTFLVAIPYKNNNNNNNDDDDDCKEEEVPLCVSGNTLTNNVDTSGCELYSQSRNFILCECTHLTAFSALLVSTEDGDCGGWEWGVIQTIAAAMLVTCLILIIVVSLFEHYYYYRPMYAAFNKAIAHCEGVK